jgi:hypothetical protein
MRWRDIIVGTVIILLLGKYVQMYAIRVALQRAAVSATAAVGPDYKRTVRRMLQSTANWSPVN